MGTELPHRFFDQDHKKCATFFEEEKARGQRCFIKKALFGRCTLSAAPAFPEVGLKQAKEKSESAKKMTKKTNSCKKMGRSELESVFDLYRSPA